MKINMLIDLLCCPKTGESVFISGNALKTESGRIYNIHDGIPLMFIEEDGGPLDEVANKVTRGVRDFYSDSPFPNYNNFDDIGALIASANKGIFARLLSEQIPPNSSVLEVGCGTGQLSNYLAATTMSRIYGVDMTLESLVLGQNFARKNKIEGITFAQMNLFRPCIKPASMDIVIANGVFHHTYDTRKAFISICSLVKPGGFIILGLYNRIGRLRTDARRILMKIFGESILILDPHLRKDLSQDKRRAWIKDQYLHPHERKHSMAEILSWFEEARFDFVSSIPKIMDQFEVDEEIFKKLDAGSSIDRVLAEIGMLFSNLGGEGGLFTMIGRKR